MRSTNQPPIDRDQLARGLEPLFGDLPDDILDEVVEHFEPRKRLAEVGAEGLARVTTSG